MSAHPWLTATAAAEVPVAEDLLSDAVTTLRCLADQSEAAHMALPMLRDALARLERVEALRSVIREHEDKEEEGARAAE